MSRGKFLVLEGIDGAGKSTQIQLLAQALRERGLEPVLSREPTDGAWGRKLRESATTGRMSAADELEHFIRDRTEHVAQLIEPSLAAGRWVILDRYYYSTVAYQGVRGGDEGMDPHALQQKMESLFPRPDRVFLLDLDPVAAIKRIRHGRGEALNEFEQRESLERIRRIFLSLEGDEIVMIDANRSNEEVHQSILAALPLP
jgi:dTMP kinase